MLAAKELPLFLSTKTLEEMKALPAPDEKPSKFEPRTTYVEPPTTVTTLTVQRAVRFD